MLRAKLTIYTMVRLFRGRFGISFLTLKILEIFHSTNSCTKNKRKELIKAICLFPLLLFLSLEKSLLSFLGIIPIIISMPNHEG